MAAIPATAGRWPGVQLAPIFPGHVAFASPLALDRLYRALRPVQRPLPPAGDQWLHEVKQDGFRLMARRDAAGIRLLTRNGHDWTSRFPQIAAAVNALRWRSCLIDGEAVCCDEEAEVARLARDAEPGLQLSECLDRPRRYRVSEHACQLGYEGSCRSGAARGTSLADRAIGSRPKIPNHPAVLRLLLLEEDWNG